MSFDSLFELLKAVLSGRTDLGAALAAPVALLLVFAFALLSTVPLFIKAERHGLAATAFLLAGGLSIAFVVATSGKGVSVSGPKTAPGQDQLFELHAGQVLIGANLDGAERPIRQSTLEDCQELCTANTNCQAFTFDNTEQSCFLKREASELHAFAAAVSGIRRAKREGSSAR